MMEVVHPRCAGIDISKRDAKVCVRVAGSGRRASVQTVSTWGATTNQVLALREHLLAERVTLAVMEATSDYWKPFVRHEALLYRVGMEEPHRRIVAAVR